MPVKRNWFRPELTVIWELKINGKLLITWRWDQRASGVDRRDYVTNWEKTVQSRRPILQKVWWAEEPLTEVEAEIIRRLNAPKYYFNEDNLRRLSRSQWKLDFIRAVSVRF